MERLTALTALVLKDMGGGCGYGRDHELAVRVRLPPSLRHLRLLSRRWVMCEKPQPFWVGQHSDRCGAAQLPELTNLVCGLTAWLAPLPPSLTALRLRMPSCHDRTECTAQHERLLGCIAALPGDRLKCLHLAWDQSHGRMGSSSAAGAALLLALPRSLAALNLANNPPRAALLGGGTLDNLSGLSVVYSEELVDEFSAASMSLTACRHLALPAMTQENHPPLLRMKLSHLFISFWSTTLQLLEGAVLHTTNAPGILYLPF